MCCLLQPAPNVRVLGHEDIEAGPSRLSSQAADHGHSDKALRSVKGLEMDPRSSATARRTGVRSQKRRTFLAEEEVCCFVILAQGEDEESQSAWYHSMTVFA